MSPPLILDCDASVLPLGLGEKRLDVREWQETVRFGVTWPDFARFSAFLETRLSADEDCVLTGSGDFHHLSLFLLRHKAKNARWPENSLDLVVCDNHPDNMRYPFGLHCGSWVCHAAALPCVRHVHVVGMTSADVGNVHALENHLRPLWRKKLTYWSIGVKSSWLSLIRRGEQGRCFDSAPALLSEFLPVLRKSPRVYLSLDKDVLAPDVAQTNWDQGVFRLEDLEAILRECKGRKVGADICGDPSFYRYASLFKRLLSRLDGQKSISPEILTVWQEEHRALNCRLVRLLTEGSWRTAVY